MSAQFNRLVLRIQDLETLSLAHLDSAQVAEQDKAELLELCKQFVLWQTQQSSL